MKDSIEITALTKDKIDLYIELGKRSYLQNYLDFWVDQDATPYLKKSFTRKIVQTESEEKNTRLFIVNYFQKAVGILKIITNYGIDGLPESETLFIEKIYLLEEYSGKGIGSKVLSLVETFAKKSHKTIIWLDAMVKGKAIPFYLRNGFKVHSSKNIGYTTIKDDKREMHIMVKKI